MGVLDKKVEKLQKEVDILMSLAGLGRVEVDTSLIQALSDLGAQKRMIIRMMVLEGYLQIDNKMSILIADFFFKYVGSDDDEIERIATSDEFIVFEKKILNEMPFLRKVAVIEGFITLPKNIKSDIGKINDIRNAIAHALVPEKLGKHRVEYKGKLLFSLEGAEQFNKDIDNIMSFFQDYFLKTFERNI